MKMIYIYKDNMYDSVPIKHYHVLEENTEGDVIYITIDRKIPNLVHLLVIITVFVLNVIMLHDVSSNISYTNHISSIPSVMYYDRTNNILDIDITNDLSNYESISIELLNRNGDTVFNITGIRVGSSIGSIQPLCDIYTLPEQYTLKYTIFDDGKQLTKEYTVLIVERNIM